VAATKPVLVFDGKCGFCSIWIEYWKQLTGDAIDYAASQEVAGRYPQIPSEDFKRSVQLVQPSGEVSSGARAVFETLAVRPSRRWMLSAYQSVPGLAPAAELAYRTIAGHRNFFYWITVLLFGREIRPLTYDAVQSVFVKCLAVIWLVAFVSFGVQADGLIGSHGVQPVGEYLSRVREFLGGGAWHAAPTLFWLNSSDAAVRIVWIAGALSAVLAYLGVVRRAALLSAFILYLSLLNGTQEFLSFQWDLLLLEAGLLAIFLGYSTAIIWMFRWLLFRLMFLSGAVKLLSGDLTWHSLTALTFHFETQPIPTALAWYAHQLPEWFLRASCAAVLFIELGAPFLVLGPRRLRLIALPAIAGLQVLIMLTGNYAFFNWLTLALCLFLVDDGWLGKSSLASTRRPVIAAVVVVVVGTLSSLFMVRTLSRSYPRAIDSIVSFIAPFGITSSYGLFANMTTQRPEIIIEGSNDGTTWLPYEFRYKPGRLDRPPPWVAPHQPRLDWQMWFAALGSYRENVWLLDMMARILEGAPAVLGLLDRNPFPDAPPKFLRAQTYEYRFSDWRTGHETGNWWARKPAGTYVPAVSLQDLRRVR
jgi:lipase maturation factor 1